MAEGISGLAELLYQMRRHGRADDYWERHIKQLEDVTVDELNALLMQWLDPQHFVWLLAGEATQIDEAANILQVSRIDRITGTGDIFYDTQTVNAA